MADTANRSRGSGRRVRGAFAPEARCGYRNPTLSSILATQMPCRSCRSGACRKAGIVRCCLGYLLTKQKRAAPAVKRVPHAFVQKQNLFLFFLCFLSPESERGPQLLHCGPRCPCPCLDCSDYSTLPKFCKHFLSASG